MNRFALPMVVGIVMLLSTNDVWSKTTVAYTVAATDSQNTMAKKLAEALPPLLMLSLGDQENLQVVERAELAAITDELGRGLENQGKQQPKVGQLDEADLLVGVLLSRAEEDQSLYALVRITEGPTAVVRTIRAVPISEEEIEDTASEISEMVVAVVAGKAGSQPTIAVLPFDSIEQFGRLIPLERGIRDLFVSEFQRRNRVRVVQRSSMAQLLTELDLVRSGLTRRGSGLEGAPTRQSAFVIRGTIDEEINGKDSMVLIKGELVDTASTKPVYKFDKACQRSKMLIAIAELVDQIEEFTLGDVRHEGLKLSKVIDTKAAADRLFQRAYADVGRFQRYLPHDGGISPFRIPRVRISYWGEVSPDVATGRSALLKAIDRLESALFIDPNRPEATFALAYCLSFHVEGAWNPDRCEELLDRLLAESKDERFQKLAYRLKADLYFPHEGKLYGHDQLNQANQERILIGYDKRLAIFKATPESLRSLEWVLLLRMLEQVAEWKHEPKLWRILLQAVVTELNSKSFDSRPGNIQKALRWHATSITYKICCKAGFSPHMIARMPLEQRRGMQRSLLITQPKELRNEALALLRQWSNSSDKEFALAALERLQLLKEISLEEYIRKVAQASSNKLGGSEKVYKIAKIAMQHLRKDQPQEGLELLLSQQPPEDVFTQGYRYYGRALGNCYEALGQKDEALATYLHYMETSDNLYYHGPSLAVRIRELGGPPLNKDRDFDLQYLDDNDSMPMPYHRIATDGENLYLANGMRWNSKLRVRESLPIRSVRLSDRVVRDLGGPKEGALCVMVNKGYLWAGTRSEGLWRRNLSSGDWQHWGMEHGLPTNSVIAVFVNGDRVIATVAKLVGENQLPESKGPVLVEIPLGEPAKFTVLRKRSPRPKPAQSVNIRRNKLIANGFNNRDYTLDLINGDWTDAPSESESDIAANRIVQTSPIKDENPRSGGVWTTPYTSTPYVRFFAEQNHQLWLGFSEPLHGFAESGWYRIDLSNRTLHRYGLRDGFRYDERNAIYDSVAVGGSFWLATPNGLVEVHPSEEFTKNSEIGSASN